MLYLLTASLPSFSQNQPIRPDPRWSLTVHDSMVHGPYSDFRRMAANRIVSNELRRRAAWERAAWERIADAEGERAKTIQNALEAEQVRTRTLAASNIRLQEGMIACNATASALKGWASVGKVSTFVVGVGVLGITTVAILNAAR